MRIAAIVDSPTSMQHPVIGEVLRQLGNHHVVDLLALGEPSTAEVVAEMTRHSVADLYLLKSHAPQALAAARVLERRGGLVLNSWEASAACQDRVQLTQTMIWAGLPWPRSRWYASVNELRVEYEASTGPAMPFVVKSRISRRGDLVAPVYRREDLETLGSRWRAEPVLVQEMLIGDGSDIKIWVIGESLFAARRRGPAENGGVQMDEPIPPDRLLPGWATLAWEIGRAFGLRLYGVDLLQTESGPVAVDVNAFPGFRGVSGAVARLTALIEQTVQHVEVPT